MIWGLALTAAIHALLCFAFVRGMQRSRTPQPDLGAVLTVALVTPPPRPPAPAAAGAAPPPEPAPAPAPQAPAEPVREEVHYYFPEELERPLIVLRDHTSEVEIDLPEDAAMNLFVDVQGHVVAVTFEGKAPAPEVQEQLRKAFMSMEFLPGMKQGKAVPSRIKIGITPLGAPPARATPSY
jgi:hypothetical protein